MIIIGSDHAGFRLKEDIKTFFDKHGYSYVDVGTYNDEKKVDYPDYAKKVAVQVAKNKGDKGILICGTGVGMCIAANKIKGIRAAVCYDVKTAKQSREHGDVNVLCLGGRVTKIETAVKIVNVWLNTKFSNIERHKRRIEKIKRLERLNS